MFSARLFAEMRRFRFGFPRKAIPMRPVAPMATHPKRRKLNPTSPWTPQKDADFERMYHEGKTYAEISKALRAGGYPKDRAGRGAFSESALSNRAKSRGFKPRRKGWKPEPPQPTISLEEMTARMQASGLTLNDVRDAAKSFKGQLGG
jgi:hypothetical protein